MARQTEGQKETVARVMHEFKQGELETRGGRKVRNPRQAIAIALSEAGASREVDEATNRRNRLRTRRRERAAERQDGTGAMTKAELYAEARRRDVRGRSRMSKEQLVRALRS
ncbi:DUF6496 domain-containing protein [Arenibaculum pallidiluteum]|uniref:DUF6496 domain-containing protein n=1 Tax=Arenibaculum pallidiluteum TaxID=2812559 RepID=UPI001A97C564|nr:DUF6496 domain-containing protein [Arenibaculum pallidiluteum]